MDIKRQQLISEFICQLLVRLLTWLECTPGEGNENSLVPLGVNSPRRLIVSQKGYLNPDARQRFADCRICKEDRKICSKY